MDEFIQILIFAAAMGISLLVQKKSQSNKKPATVSPKELLEDMFPETEEAQETDIVRPISTPISADRKNKPFTPHPKSQRKTCTMPPADSSKQKKKISLNTKEEARRAFIYSEIFNRKY